MKSFVCVVGFLTSVAGVFVAHNSSELIAMMLYMFLFIILLVAEQVK